MNEKIIQLLYAHEELLALSNFGKVYSFDNEKRKWVESYPILREVEFRKVTTHFPGGGSVETTF